MDSSLSEIFNLIQKIILKANTYYSSQEKTEKNKSTTLIKSLIESSFLSKIKPFNEIIFTSINALLYYYLGTFNASNEDPSVCEEPFTKSIKYFNNEISIEDAIDLIKKNSRHYAKRQYTWFNNKMNIKWFDVDYDNFSNTCNEVVKYIDKYIVNSK